MARASHPGCTQFPYFTRVNGFDNTVLARAFHDLMVQLDFLAFSVIYEARMPPADALRKPMWVL